MALQVHSRLLFPGALACKVSCQDLPPWLVLRRTGLIMIDDDHLSCRMNRRKSLLQAKLLRQLKAARSGRQHAPYSMAIGAGCAARVLTGTRSGPAGTGGGAEWRRQPPQQARRLARPAPAAQRQQWPRQSCPLSRPAAPRGGKPGCTGAISTRGERGAEHRAQRERRRTSAAQRARPMRPQEVGSAALIQFRAST